MPKREDVPSPATETDGSVHPAELPKIEEHALAEATPAWLFAAMKQHNAWGQGKRLTLDDYRAAADAVANLTLGKPAGDKPATE